MNWRATVGVCVIEREGVLCGKLAGDDTGHWPILELMGVSSSSKSENSSSSSEMIIIIYSIIMFWIIVDS